MREDKESWLSFLRHLKQRGLKGTQLFVGDKCLGMIETLIETNPLARFQHCMVHFYRNVFSVIPRDKVKQVAAIHKAIQAQEDKGATLECQERIRNLADKTYDLDRTHLMVVSGEGDVWVRQSIDLFNLPQAHLLDRFHFRRALRQSFCQELDKSQLCKRLYSQGFEFISADLLACICKSRGKKKQTQKTYQYLDNN